MMKNPVKIPACFLISCADFSAFSFFSASSLAFSAFFFSAITFFSSRSAAWIVEARGLAEGPKTKSSQEDDANHLVSTSSFSSKFPFFRSTKFRLGLESWSERISIDNLGTLQSLRNEGAHLKGFELFRSRLRFDLFLFHDLLLLGLWGRGS